MPHSRFAYSLPSCLFLLLLLFAGAAAAQSYTGVVVFGDSLSDVGNVAHLTESNLLVRFPSSTFNYTDGRFTDGSDTDPAAKAYFGVWIEQFAAALPAKVKLKNSLDGGTDYAYGDAETGSGTRVVSNTVAGVTLSVTINNVGQQVSDYLATNPIPSPATLYVLWAGADDLYADSSATTVTTAVTNITDSLQKLIAAGATEFLVPNLPPLGDVPKYATSSNAAALNAAAASFRTQLATALNNLQSSAAASGKAVHIYQLDTYSIFLKAAASPMSLGLTDVTDPAQNISGNPDTYLSWDGLHPTTTGHHYAGAAAKALFTPLAASTVTLTPGTSTTVSGVSSPLKVTVTGASGVPSGLVTVFAANGTSTAPVGAAALDATGTATMDASKLAAVATPYQLTAVYAGDQVYANTASAAVPLTVVSTPIATATTVTSSNLNANVGASVTFTANVTSSAGAATGTVTFLDGTTSLGTATLDGSGNAQFSTSSLTAGSHTITAQYAASGIFAASTSAAITQVITAPSVGFTISPDSISIARGASGNTTLTFTPQGGETGTIVPSCGTLPQYMTCSFSPTSLALSGSSPQTVTLTVSTNNSSAASWTEPKTIADATGGSSGPMGALLLLPFGAGAALAMRKRRSVGSLAAVLLMAVAALGMSGCAGSSHKTASGTYAVVLQYTLNGTTASDTQILHVTVQ